MHFTPLLTGALIRERGDKGLMVWDPASPIGSHSITDTQQQKQQQQTDLPLTSPSSKAQRRGSSHNTHHEQPVSGGDN